MIILFGMALFACASAALGYRVAFTVLRKANAIAFCEAKHCGKVLAIHELEFRTCDACMAAWYDRVEQDARRELWRTV